MGNKAQLLNYGLIGNGQTCALVSQAGSLDWLCLPAFDSPFVFDKILDAENGACFSIQPSGSDRYTTSQEYAKNSNVLMTTYQSDKASFRIHDFMPRWEIWDGSSAHAPMEAYRYVEVLSGEPEVIVHLQCRLNYQAEPLQYTILDHATVLFQNESEKIYLTCSVSPQDVVMKQPIRLRGPAFFVLSYGEPVHEPTVASVKEKLDRTNLYWQRWIKNCYLPDEYQKEIVRSLLTLKQLQYHRTGAFVAAPTTSIPEEVGGHRNWDYRFCWIRDSYFTVNALLKLSKFEESESFIAYMAKILEKETTLLRPLYTIDGNPVPPVTSLTHLPGYLDSKPVRIGNDATYHNQTDVYGEAILIIYPLFMDERVVRTDYQPLWKDVEKLVSMAIAKFPEKDNGIWEIENPPRHYTFSKLLCWAAVDRGCKIAYRLKHDRQYRTWNSIRNRMKDEILKKAWNDNVQAFTQYYGGDSLDSSTLLMPVLDLIDGKDPRMVATVQRSEEQLMRNGLMFRYTNHDGLGIPNNAFTICTFWLIDALILSGQKKKARKYFENMLSFGNHLNLFSEHINPDTGQMTGNFPQAYTHVAIINSAILLAEH